MGNQAVPVPIEQACSLSRCSQSITTRALALAAQHYSRQQYGQNLLSTARVLDPTSTIRFYSVELHCSRNVQIATNLNSQM